MTRLGQPKEGSLRSIVDPLERDVGEPRETEGASPGSGEICTQKAVSGAPQRVSPEETGIFLRALGHLS